MTSLIEVAPSSFEIAMLFGWLGVLFVAGALASKLMGKS